jgi:hypothetical protein
MPGRLRALWDDASREGDAKSKLKKKRVDLEKSLRVQHWTTSKALVNFKSRLGRYNERIDETMTLPWLGAFLKKRSWTSNWMFRFPVVVVLRPVFFVLRLIVTSLFYAYFFSVALARLVPTYVKFQRVKLRELAAFDRKIADDKRKRELEKQLKLKNKQLRIDEQKRREQAVLAEQLTVFWVREFRNSSSETLLEVWAVFQQFSPDHYIYYMLENSPGPVLREIVDREVALRQISIEARQLALLRLERKMADTTQANLIQQIASSAQKSAAEQQSGLMDGLMAIAMIQLVK